MLVQVISVLSFFRQSGFESSGFALTSQASCKNISIKYYYKGIFKDLKTCSNFNKAVSPLVGVKEL